MLDTVTQLDLILLQTTVHGQCLTEYTLDSANAVSLSRDLSHCDGFQSREAPSSPLALLQRMVSDEGQATGLPQQGDNQWLRVHWNLQLSLTEEFAGC